MGVLRKIHTALQARFIRWFRIRQAVQVYRIMHADELSKTPMEGWPLLRAKQTQEIRLLRAGKLDSVVDRKSWAYPYLPSSVQRLSMPVAKTTPYNLRRFARTPVARRAINLIKNAVTAQTWDIRPIDGVPVEDEEEQKARIKIAQKIFKHPNNIDSHQSWLEMGIEDMCTMGAFASEIRLTMNPERPVKLWVMDVATVRIFVSWSESTPDLPHYAQMTGLQGERGAILFYDDELMYIKDNPASDNPFGLGKLEVAFQQLNDLLGVQRMAGMAGADQVHKTWLWWEQPQSDNAYQIVRRHIQNELEGQSKVSIIGGMKKPEVLEVQPVTEEDLLLNWQEMLIRMVANAFDMTAMALGVEHDVNRAVGEVLQDQDFRSAVVPMAKRIQEGLTRKILHEALGWVDLEYAFLQLDDPDLETKTEMNAKMYSANALTPNEWRKSVGKQPLKDPFSDLTQFQAMLLNQQAMAELMDQQQQAQQARQQQNQQQQQMQPGPFGGPMPPMPGMPHHPGVTPPPQGGGGGGSFGGGGGGGMRISQGSISRGGQVISPRPLALPKFPITGSKWNAKQIAQMPLNDLAQRIDGGELPEPKKLLPQMVNQMPNILEDMSDDVKQYFKSMLQQDEEKEGEADPDDYLKGWLKKMQKRYKKREARSDDMTEYLQNVNKKWRMAQPMKPGAKNYRAVKNPGKPGTPPAARSL